MDNREDMPMGFAFGLAVNEQAMDSFARMTDEEKRQVLEAARSATSKEQMRGIVEDIARLK